METKNPDEFNICVAANLYGVAENKFPVTPNSISLTKLKDPILATHEGKYTWNLSSCVSSKKKLAKGTYILVPSTFEPSTQAAFEVLLYSTLSQV